MCVESVLCVQSQCYVCVESVLCVCREAVQSAVQIGCGSSTDS